jgi:hypothetical protein
MEKKLRYVYQLSLSNGKILINECDGLFSVNNPQDPEDKVLINSAVLIKMFEVEEEMQVQDSACADDTCAPCDDTSSCTNNVDQANQDHEQAISDLN